MGAKRMDVCRDCGCSDDAACRTAAGPCWWVIEPTGRRRGLCSGCAAKRSTPPSKASASAWRLARNSLRATGRGRR